METTKTLFEKICDREIPSDIVYEDNDHLAFFTINPNQKGHTLLIPKKPYRWFTNMPTNEWQNLANLTKKMAKAMIETLDVDYCEISIVGEEVPHTHIHLIPQTEDGRNPSIHISYDSDEEKENYRQKLADAFKSI